MTSAVFMLRFIEVTHKLQMTSYKQTLCCLPHTVFISSAFPEQLSLMAPTECPHLILQAVAGPMAAATASTITNPMDVVRARVQVRAESLNSYLFI